MYKTDLFQNTGIINNYNPRTRKYSMKTMDGTVLKDLHENISQNLAPILTLKLQATNYKMTRELRIYMSSMNSIHINIIHQIDSAYSTTITNLNILPWYNNQDDYKYLVCIFRQRLRKGIHDLDILYDILCNRLRAHNMFIHTY